MKKAILSILLVSIFSQSFCWNWSAPLHTIGSSMSSFCSKKPLVTAAIGFVAGSCITAGVTWFLSKLRRKKQPKKAVVVNNQTPVVEMRYEHPQNQEQEYVSNYDLLCAVHFVAKQVQEFENKLIVLPENEE